MSIFDQLVKARRADPFTPFAIVLRQGGRVEVTRRMQFATNGKEIVVLDERDGSHFYHFDNIDHIEVLQTAA